MQITAVVVAIAAVFCAARCATVHAGFSSAPLSQVSNYVDPGGNFPFPFYHRPGIDTRKGTRWPEDFMTNANICTNSKPLLN